MPKITVPLTDTEIKKSKPKEKQYKLSDGAGLCLIVPIKGKKYFRLDYTYNKKRKSISFGTYPETSLKEARIRRAEVKEFLKDGVDPGQKRKLEKNIETFESVSNKWLDMAKGDWVEVTYIKAVNTLKNDTLLIKDKEMKRINRIDILDVIGIMQKRGVHTSAKRLLGYFDRIWKYAVTYNIVEHNIIADIDTRNALQQITKKHFPAITDEDGIRLLMNDIKEYKNYKAADISMVYAFLLSPYIALRPFNLRCLEWTEIDFENRIIEIPYEKMKTKKDFVIPMSTQIYDILKEIHQYSSYISKYVFVAPADKNKSISENTINMALKRMGYTNKMTPHGFRSMFSTIVHEKINEHGHHSDIIELCLAHEERNQVKAAYNRENKMKHYEERKELMQWWANYLDGL
jgi:integrase